MNLRFVILLKLWFWIYNYITCVFCSVYVVIWYNGNKYGLKILGLDFKILCVIYIVYNVIYYCIGFFVFIEIECFGLL